MFKTIKEDRTTVVSGSLTEIIGNTYNLTISGLTKETYKITELL